MIFVIIAASIGVIDSILWYLFNKLYWGEEASSFLPGAKWTKKLKIEISLSFIVWSRDISIVSWFSILFYICDRITKAHPLH